MSGDQTQNAGSDRATDVTEYVGYRHPPRQHQFKPGQSGNPKGRPKGSAQLNHKIGEILSRKVVFRNGEKEERISLLVAGVIAQAAKAAKGDVRSASLTMKWADKVGLLNDRHGTESDVEQHDAERSGAVLVQPGVKERPSDRLTEGVDLALLSRPETTELSRLAQIIDLGGDFTALSTNDFDRLKSIVNKGRGKDITPQ